MARIGRRGSRSPARARGSIARGFGSLRFAGLCPEGIDRPSTPLGGFDRISRFKSWPNLIGGTSCPRSRHPYLLRAWFRRSGIAQPTGIAGLDRMLLVARAAVARTYLKAWERHVGNRRASRGRSSRLAIRGRTAVASLSDAGPEAALWAGVVGRGGKRDGLRQPRRPELVRPSGSSEPLSNTEAPMAGLTGHPYPKLGRAGLG